MRMKVSMEHDRVRSNALGERLSLPRVPSPHSIIRLSQPLIVAFNQIQTDAYLDRLRALNVAPEVYQERALKIRLDKQAQKISGILLQKLTKEGADFVNALEQLGRLLAPLLKENCNPLAALGHLQDNKIVVTVDGTNCTLESNNIINKTAQFIHEAWLESNPEGHFSLSAGHKITTKTLSDYSVPTGRYRARNLIGAMFLARALYTNDFSTKILSDSLDRSLEIKSTVILPDSPVRLPSSPPEQNLSPHSLTKLTKVPNAQEIKESYATSLTKRLLALVPQMAMQGMRKWNAFLIETHDIRDAMQHVVATDFTQQSITVEHGYHYLAKVPILIANKFNHPGYGMRVDAAKKRLDTLIRATETTWTGLESAIPLYELKTYSSKEAIATIQEKLIAIGRTYEHSAASGLMGKEGGVRFNFLRDPGFFTKNAEDLEIVTSENPTTGEVYAFSIIYKPGSAKSMEKWGHLPYKNPAFFALYGKNPQTCASLPSLTVAQILNATFFASEVNLVFNYDCGAHGGAVWLENRPSIGFLTRTNHDPYLPGATYCDLTADVHLPTLRPLTKEALNDEIF